jgi:hypothetical protein
MIFWPWASGQGDLAYPGSLDGHIWRPMQLMSMISGGAWTSPNALEAHLAAACQHSLLPLMIAFEHSCVVGNPINSVQDSQSPNRYGEKFRWDPYDINDQYLQGSRLDLASVGGVIDGAHCEIDLGWSA